ncbi:MAG: hypothetical protein ACXWR1_14785 [Bdellovibrionota bacterium]
MKILKTEGYSFGDLENEQTVVKIAFRKCMMAMAMPTDKAKSRPCSTGYTGAIQYIVRSDHLIGDACELIKSAGAISCDKGQAECMKGAQEKFAAAKQKLQESSEYAQKSMMELKRLSIDSRIMAQTVSMHFQTIAAKLRTLPPQSKPLSNLDPAVDQALGTQNVEGTPLDITMARFHIASLDPAAFDKKAEEMNAAISSSDVSAKDENPFSQQLASSITSRDAAEFTKSSQQYASVTGQLIDKQTKAFSDFRENAGVAKPAEAGNQIAAAPSPAKAAVATNIAPTSPTASSEPSNSSSASRAPAAGSLSSAAPEFANPDPSPIPAYRPTRAPLSRAGASSTRQTPESISLASPSPNKESAVATRALDSGKGTNSPAKASGAGIEEVARVAILTANESSNSETHAKPFLGALSAPVASSPLERPAVATSESSVSAAIASASPAAKAQAEKFAAAEISKMEAKSGPMTSSVREMLRKRLAGSFADRLQETKIASASAKAASSANVAESVLAAAAESVPAGLSADTFRMASADTDAEVRRLMAQEADHEQLSNGDLGSQNESLFVRVHAAHQRRFR